MDLAELAEHVKDSKSFEFPWGRMTLPSVAGFQISKFMVLELIAASLMLLVFLPLAKRLQGAGPARGRFWNLMEVMLLFIRDEVARPAIGKHDADRFLPLLWNIFFFILFCNLLGMVPWAGSPTGAVTVTVALAAITFAAVVGTGIGKFGVGGYFKSLVPHMDVPKAIAGPLVVMLFVLELCGLLIKHVVLAVRLLANMFAGHLVLAVVLTFILIVAEQTSTYKFLLVPGVTAASIIGAVALSLLELFVAFLQAYIFTFLSALFIGTAMHPH
jgi:F-type H+-transporting ATPase subunit a